MLIRSRIGITRISDPIVIFRSGINRINSYGVYTNWRSAVVTSNAVRYLCNYYVCRWYHSAGQVHECWRLFYHLLCLAVPAPDTTWLVLALCLPVSAPTGQWASHAMQMSGHMTGVWETTPVSGKWHQIQAARLQLPNDDAADCLSKMANRDCNTGIPVFRNTVSFSNTEIPVLRRHNTGICGIAIVPKVAHKNDEIGRKCARYSEYSRYKVVSMTNWTSVYRPTPSTPCSVDVERRVCRRISGKTWLNDWLW